MGANLLERLAVMVFVVLLLKTAPYGRFTQTGWGPMVPSKLGWIVMESPAVLLFGLSSPCSSGWLLDPRFVIGGILFAGGLAIHTHSDAGLVFALWTVARQLVSRRITGPVLGVIASWS